MIVIGLNHFETKKRNVPSDTAKGLNISGKPFLTVMTAKNAYKK